MSKIPLAVLKPLSASTWKTDEYNLNGYIDCLEGHSHGDKKSGYTSRYIFRDKISATDGMTKKEIDAIIKTGIIPDCFYQDKDKNVTEINQHYLHSIQQFYSNCQTQWDKHIDRTNALIGTPSGTLYK